MPIERNASSTTGVLNQLAVHATIDDETSLKTSPAICF